MKRFVLPVLFGLAVALAGDLPVIQPADLASQLKASGSKTLVIQVGPNVLYRSHHIPNSVYGGPAGKPEGLEVLKAAVKDVPHDREVVIYCGCCPWDRCPNIKPALELLKQLGFAHVKAMYSGTNFKTDWIDKGYPVDPPATAGEKF